MGEIGELIEVDLIERCGDQLDGWGEITARFADTSHLVVMSRATGGRK